MHYSAADELTATYPKVDDALEGERKSVGGMLVERFWDQGRDWFGWSWAARGHRGGPDSQEVEGRCKNRAACTLDARGHHP